MEELNMNNKLDLQKTSEYILSQDAMKDYSDEEILQLEATVEQLISEYSWPKVYEVWINYLHTKCKSDEAVINFAQNFFDYAHERHIPDPIHFIAYLYYRVDAHKNELAFDIFDSLAITILPNAGLVDIVQNPGYAAEADPRIQAEIAVIKAQEDIRNS